MPGAMQGSASCSCICRLCWLAVLCPTIARATLGLQALIGQQTVEEFLRETWGSQWRLYRSKGRSFADLWSLALMEHVVSDEDIRPIAYEKDLKLVKEGKTYFTSEEPVEWKQVQKGLEGGASLVMNSINKFHVPMRALCIDVERKLHTWASVNAYLTPGQKIGFQPHYDTTDSFALQVEGRKLWYICRWDSRAAEGFNFFKFGEDLGNCTELVLDPGDVLYMPAGIVHYAQAVNTEYSLHLSVSIQRSNFAWSEFFKDLANPEEENPPPFAKELSASMGASVALNEQLPRLAELERSIENRDMPKGFVAEWRRTASQLIESEGLVGGLAEHLSGNLAHDAVLWHVVLMMRMRLVRGSLRQLRNCPGSAGFDPEGRFTRAPGSLLILHKEDAQLVLFVETLIVELQTSWMDGVRFALSAFAAGTSQGSSFTLAELKQKTKTEKEAKKLLQVLLENCALVMLESNGTTPALPNLNEEL